MKSRMQIKSFISNQNRPRHSAGCVVCRQDRGRDNGGGGGGGSGEDGMWSDKCVWGAAAQRAEQGTQIPPAQTGDRRNTPIAERWPRNIRHRYKNSPKKASVKGGLENTLTGQKVVS